MKKLLMLPAIIILIALDYLFLEFVAEPFWNVIWPAPIVLAATFGIMAVAFWPGLLRRNVVAWIAGTFGVLLGQSYIVQTLVATPGFSAIAAAFAILTSIVVALLGYILLQVAGLTKVRRFWAWAEQYMVLVPIVIMLLIINFLMVVTVNTLLWPYLWPKPVYVLVVALVAVLLFPQVGRTIWALRLVSFMLAFIGECYLLHSVQVVFFHFSIIALLHFIGVTGMTSVVILNCINQSSPKSNKVAPSLPAELPFVAIVVPTYNEPYRILETTVLSLKELDYPADKMCIIISDDGHRPEIRDMARLHDIYYNEGARKDAKAGNLNSALRYIDANFPQASLILTQDADDVIVASFLQKTVGYFNDPLMALVQTPKDAYTPEHDPFGTRDRMFYDVFQPGRNGFGAAFACGSGVIWNIDAVKSIGGFSTWNLVEDLTTSYRLHSAGYHSEYHNEVLSIGLAPDDIPGLLKQRGTWAVDNWRLFLFDNPLRKKGLTLGQRLQYMELGMFYTTSILFTPLMMLIPLLTLLTGQFIPIEGSALFPWIMITLIYYVVLSQGKGMYLLRMWQFWIGHWPTYTQAFFVAIRSRDKKPKYVVTRKTREAGFYGQLLWAQFLYIGLGVVAILRALFFMPNVDLVARVTNIGILIFFMVMVGGMCRAAFYGMEPFAWKSLFKLPSFGGKPEMRREEVSRTVPQAGK
ncbi:MAG: glycosyltransferase family 2 protein [Chloroflexota bacterium]